MENYFSLNVQFYSSFLWRFKVDQKSLSLTPSDFIITGNFVYDLTGANVAVPWTATFWMIGRRTPPPLLFQCQCVASFRGHFGPQKLLQSDFSSLSRFYLQAKNHSTMLNRPVRSVKTSPTGTGSGGPGPGVSLNKMEEERGLARSKVFTKYELNVFPAFSLEDFNTLKQCSPWLLFDI